MEIYAASRQWPSQQWPAVCECSQPIDIKVGSWMRPQSGLWLMKAVHLDGRLSEKKAALSVDTIVLPVLSDIRDATGRIV